MSYSIKKYIQKECSKEYNLEDIDLIAQNISTDSLGKYSKNSALKIICKYAKVENGKIIFDSEERDMNKTFDDIKISIHSENNSDNKKDKNKDKNKDNNSDSDKNKNTKKKGGFGSFKNIQIIDEDCDSDIEIISESKKESCSSTSKNKGFGNFKKELKDIEIDTDNTNNNIKKGGFGAGFSNFNKLTDVSIFKKIDDIDQVDEKNRTENLNTDSYIYPIENKYNGLIRKETKYGPYGTDSIHDEQKDDHINSIEKKRTKQYNILNEKIYPPQRSAEWFKMRDEMITASDGGTIVGFNPYENQYDFVFKKVFGKPFITSIDCYHGKKYEGIATLVYEYRMNVSVKEFGLCRHPKYKFLGASPDGIVSPYKLDGVHLTKYVGRMLEIKCPMRREIKMEPDAIEVYGVHDEPITDIKKDVKKGICPTYYWVQVQLQLQCCELDECDFWQCEIWEYNDVDEFKEDSDSVYPWLSQYTKQEKGAVIQIMPFDKLVNTDDDDNQMTFNERIWNFAEFIYPPRIEMTPFEIDQWILETIHNLSSTHPGKVFERVLYWKVNKTRNITIKRDDEWFNKNVTTFDKIWKYVEYFRENKDKAKLLKEYVGSQKKKYNNKIMDVIEKLYKGATTDYIKSLEEEINKKTNHFPVVDDHEDNLTYIIETLNMEMPDDVTDEDKTKFKQFVKDMKKKVDKYLLNDK
jgi:putative phage-type endonuclease